MAEKDIIAVYDRDSKRYHRYLIEGQGITGGLYFPKDEEIPKEVRISLVVRRDGQNEGAK